jgi:hypothetical protein
VLCENASKPGRPLNLEVGLRVIWEKKHGKTALEIKKILDDEGTNLSLEAVEAFLKKRWAVRVFKQASSV